MVVMVDPLLEARTRLKNARRSKFGGWAAKERGGDESNMTYEP